MMIKHHWDVELPEDGTVWCGKTTLSDCQWNNWRRERCVPTDCERINRYILYSASMDVGDVQKCGNYKDIKFMSHTTEVWENSWFNTVLSLTIS